MLMIDISLRGTFWQVLLPLPHHPPALQTGQDCGVLCTGPLYRAQPQYQQVSHWSWVMGSGLVVKIFLPAHNYERTINGFKSFEQALLSMEDSRSSLDKLDYSVLPSSEAVLRVAGRGKLKTLASHCATVLITLLAVTGDD